MIVALVFTPEPLPTVSPVPEISPEVGDWAAALSTIFAAAILFLAGLLWRRANSWFAEVIADVKATKVQTTNSHKTNLRDDLTQALITIDSVAESMCEMKNSLEDVKSSMDKLDSRQTEVHADLRETRKDLRFATEYVRDVDKRFVEHLDEERKKNGGSNG